MGGVPERSAVVVGAGVGGLAAAGALSRAGWRVTLLEATDRLRAGPAALLLWPAGVRALRALDLGHGLDAISTRVAYGLRRPDGAWLAGPEHRAVDRGAPLLVHAGDLHDALMAGLGDRVEVRTGVTVRGPAGPDRPAVTDGRSQWSADLVVAADGADSVLRPWVVPRSRVVPSGATAWRAVIPWYRAPELPADVVDTGHTVGTGYQFFAASLHRRGATGGDSRGGRYWWATLAGAPRPEPAGTQLELLRRWFADWHPPVPELLAATEPDDLVQQELRTIRPALPRYSVPAGAGGVVLLGDAGHPVAEHLGQGACLALEDAATLVAMVRHASPGRPLHDALAGYSAARRPRVAEALRRSRRLAATGPAGRSPTVQARRRHRAATAAGEWQPPD